MNKNNLEKNERLTKVVKGLAYLGVMTAGVMYFTELAYAKFDVNAGVGAATGPLIEGIKAHWGKGVLLTGSGAALFGEGDGRQRAIRAAIAAGSAGAVVLGMIALLID